MDITPNTRVGELLEAHPELEDGLIALVPAFAKLRNPVLRATVAKVATLEHAALVGGIPLPDLIGHLRRALGQAEEVPSGTTAAVAAAGSEATDAWPSWYVAKDVVAELSVAKVLAGGDHPLAVGRKLLIGSPRDAIVVLASEFEPAPLLEQVRRQGILAACVRQGTGYRTALKMA
jgi:hypothetical protein